MEVDDERPARRAAVGVREHASIGQCHRHVEHASETTGVSRRSGQGSSTLAHACRNRGARGVSSTNDLIERCASEPNSGVAPVCPGHRQLWQIFTLGSQQPRRAGSRASATRSGSRNYKPRQTTRVQRPLAAPSGLAHHRADSARCNRDACAVPLTADAEHGPAFVIKVDRTPAVQTARPSTPKRTLPPARRPRPRRWRTTPSPRHPRRRTAHRE